ncbi:HK97-gp10 family putative phage morphogenesis protein [Deinococcus oregonensis]|uniref:HK97-gp10 family putative phage morphogenesis protein n=1 Tax=Deinococcus oregonensis TaxID=1805970 RepID=A0ABV6B2T9_9DEIO
MAFKATNIRAASVDLARKKAAVQALNIRNEAVSAAPVDTGRLRQSIGLQRRSPDVWRVGTNVNYAPFVEFGTRHQAAQPFMRPAFEKVMNRG